MPATTIQGPFPHRWTADRLMAPPLIAPARHYTYPRLVPGEEDTLARGALELLVRPATGGSFLATCALGFSDPRMPTALWACPAADTLCAVAGGYAYLVNTLDPAECTHLGLRPVVEVMAAETEQLLLFAGFDRILAWGAEGLRWQTGRLSWEGLTLGEVRDGVLHGLGWEMFLDCELAFAVDLQTGEHSGGGYRPR